MPRILFLHPSNELYGADKVLLAILDALPAHYDVEVWLPQDVTYSENMLFNELRNRGIEVSFRNLAVLRRSYINVKGLLSLVPRLFDTIVTLRKTKFDLLYINTSALALMVPIGRFLGMPTILHLHEYLQGGIKAILTPFISFSSHVLCVSRAVRDVLPRGVRARSSVIYNGFNVQNLASPDENVRLSFLIASRWNSWKGHATVLAAWEKANRSDAELHVYGGPPEVGEAVDVPEIVSRMSNSNTVYIHGQVQNISDALKKCHVVLVPSSNPDPLPTIAIEAAGSGRAVIASDCGGLPEIVVAGSTGWLVPPSSEQAWTQVLNTVSRSDLLAAGDNARRRYESLFQIERFGKDILTLIEKQIGPDSTPR
ncbi:glycosyltransferase family 4 protein [Pseudarthrobacter phenanthrenivorans]|uniref:glycosyltransferase family 4 protein n=1 Tax=Pseudarthrobacter phenanthrenivorans TaxID=361575 RepID=UPI00344E3EAE